MSVVKVMLICGGLDGMLGWSVMIDGWTGERWEERERETEDCESPVAGLQGIYFLQSLRS